MSKSNDTLAKEFKTALRQTSSLGAAIKRSPIPNIQLDKHGEEALQLLSEQQILGGLTVPTTLYADLSLFKDYLLGAVLYLISQRSPEDHELAYTYIQSKMEDYRNRHHNLIEKIFPTLNLTYNDVISVWQEPLFHMEIFKRSFPTPYIATTVDNIAINHNHRRIAGLTSPITMTINTYPLILPEGVTQLVTRDLEIMFGIGVTLVYIPLTEFTDKMFESYDQLEFSDPHIVMENRDIQKLFENLKTFDKHIHTPPLIHPSMIPKQNYDYKHLKMSQEEGMNALCRFKYIPVPLISAM